MRFRAFVKSVQFRNVLETADSVFLALTQKCYRVQYVKDTALARCMDENCMAFLMNYQLTLGNETLGYFSRSADLRKSLSAKLNGMDFAAFELLGELCATAKTVAAYTRNEFFEYLYTEGLLALSVKAFAHPFPPTQSAKVKVAVSDAIICLMATLPAKVREYFLQDEQRSDSSLLHVVCESMLQARDISALLQLSELFHALLDPSPDKRFAEVFDAFYDHIVGSMITKLQVSSIPDEETRICVCEVLSIITQCVQTHGFRVRFLLLNHDVLGVVLRLLDLKEKSIALAAVRVFRAVIEKSDLFVIKHVISQNLLQRLWTLFLENGPKENMLFSSILALIHAAKQADNALLFEHIVQRHMALFTDSPLRMHFDYFEQRYLAEKRAQEPYALWNPREIRARDEEDEDCSLKRKFSSEEEAKVYGKKTKLESGDG